MMVAFSEESDQRQREVLLLATESKRLILPVQLSSIPTKLHQSFSDFSVSNSNL